MLYGFTLFLITATFYIKENTTILSFPFLVLCVFLCARAAMQNVMRNNISLFEGGVVPLSAFSVCLCYKKNYSSRIFQHVAERFPPVQESGPQSSVVQKDLWFTTRANVKKLCVIIVSRFLKENLVNLLSKNENYNLYFNPLL